MKKHFISLTLLTLLTAAALTGCSLPEVKKGPTFEQVSKAWNELSNLSVETHSVYPEQDQVVTKYLSADSNDPQKKKIRFEYEAMGQTVVMVANNEDNLFFIYNPALNAYYLDKDNEILASIDATGPFFGKELLEQYKYDGDEVIDGVDTLRYIGTNGENQEQVVYWMTRDTYLPVKNQFISDGGDMVIENRSTVDFPQTIDTKLFQIPEDAKETEIEDIFNDNNNEQE